jgi:hypothetical protein
VSMVRTDTHSISTSLRQAQTPLWNTVDLDTGHGAGHFYPAPHRGVCNLPEIAWDLSRNRIYVAYADLQSSSILPNTDLFLQYADYNSQSMAWQPGNNGEPLETAQDSSTAQFMQAIAVDQASGNVAVGWYDGRNDTNNVTSHNTKVQYYAAVSRDRGISFGQPFQVTSGQSDSSLLDWNGLPSNQIGDFLDYTAVAYEGGVLYAAWADNANSPVPNFYNGHSYLDIYVAVGIPPCP